MNVSNLMADGVSDIPREGGEVKGEEVTMDHVSDEKLPDIQVDESQLKPKHDVKTTEKDGQAVTPQSQATRCLSPRTLVITPSGGEGATGTDEVGVTLSSTVRRVSFQQENDSIKVQLAASKSDRPAGIDDINDLKVPGAERYTPSISPSTTPIPQPPLSEYGSEYSYRSSHTNDQQWHRRLFKKRDSEWVFRPLKLKFKVKELEELYRNYVYRQQQSLVCTACLIMVFLSVMVSIFFFANLKVRSSV